MADIEIRRAHNLGLEAARAAADEMSGRLGRKFGLQGRWEGNVLRFERPGVTGSLAITEKELDLSVALGFLLKAMKGSIQQAVEEELAALFAKAKKPVTKKPASPRKKGG